MPSNYAEVTQRATAPSERSPAARRGARIAWVGIVVSVVSLYFAFRNVDLRQLAVTLGHTHLGFIVPMVAAQALFFWLKAWRWRLLLTPVQLVATGSLVTPMMIGFMGNNVLPARLGEVIRVYLGARLLHLAPSPVLATLVLERMFDLVAIMGLLGWGVVMMGSVPQALLSAGYALAAVSIAGMLMAAAFAIWTGQVMGLAETLTGFLSARIQRALLHHLELGAAGVTALRQPRLLTGVILSSLAQWILMATCVYVSLLAVDISVPPAAAFVVLAATAFGVMIPAAPGFVGTLHLAFVLALTPFGVDSDRAMAAAVFYHIVPFACVTLAGLLCLRHVGMRLGQVEREAVQSGT